MKRVLFAAGAAAAVAVAVIAATGASSAGGVAAVTSNISIRDRVGSQQTADFLHKGKFHLLVNSTLFDSGGSSIRPLEGNSKTLGGQNQTPISGTNTLTGKKGTLTITFQGLTVPVNVYPLANPYSIEYGTWKVTGGTGSYKGWKGNGRWADAATPAVDTIEWIGSVTH